MLKINCQTKRLDETVAKQVNCSRTKATKLVKSGNVSVDGKVIIKGSFLVKPNNKISVLNFNQINQIDINLQPCRLPLDIIYEDDYLLVINKPKNVLTHPTSFNEQDTIANRLVYYLGNFMNNTNRPGIVHRLDKNTSGLLVVAKNLDVLHQLQKQIMVRKLQRFYLCLCHNHFDKKKVTINLPICRKRNTNKMQVANIKNSKPAITEVKLLKNLPKNLTLVECKLKTGRTHQIRVHLSYINHPIFNDDIYGQNDNVKNYGQFLHAYKLSFIHPITKKRLTFTKQPDNIFKKYAKN